MSKHNQFNRNFAVIVGINSYKNKIKELQTAVADARKLAQIIQKQHENLLPQYQAHNKYEVKLFLNENASLDQLNQLILDFKQGQIPLDNEKVAVTKDDRLLFYFAGHGIALDALENQEGPVGYLIPQNAISGDSSTYLPMQELHDALNELPCKHMLAILDCCFAGAFRWASLKREIVPKVKVYKERYDRFISERAWQVITSAADDQKALDSLGSRGIITDGSGVHSPFAKALFDALCGGADQGADLNKDGIITATELYSYLRDRVEIFTEKHYQRQTPSLCSLSKHDKGEFIFLLPSFERDKLEDAPPLNKENNPYKGLQSYDEKDSNLFFGREEQIQKLFEKIVANKQPLTLVLGASGTGKSSLMKAGLLPRLRDYQEHQFKILDPMRPGESPLKSLAQICLPIADTITSLELALYEQTLANIIERWNRNNPKTKILFPIDQFEELITLCKSDQEREQFQKLIRNAITKYPDKIHVVITLRLDFEALFQNSVLEEFWNKDARFVVPLMTQNELREVIEKPASEKVLYFEPPSLVDELINEVVQMPGALPLLSFTLSELYLKYLHKRRDNRALTKEDYDDLGRVVGSITKRANQEYEKLVAQDSAYKKTVQRVMLRMISLQGGELARRQVPKSELIYADEEENKRVDKVIENFSKARLIVEGSNSEGETYIEPAHDVLVQGWNKLLEWKNQQQETLTLQRRLTPAANNWEQNHRVTGFLWNNDPRLPQLEQVVKSEDSWLNQIETKFIRRSIRNREEQDINEKKQIINLFSRASQAFFASNQLLEALIEAVKAGKELQKLRNKLQELQKEAILEESEAEISKEIDVVKNQIVITLEQAVYAVRERNRLEKHTGPVASVSFSPDGKTIASGGWDNTVILWSPEGREINALYQDFKTPEGYSTMVCSVSFSPDSETIATCGDNTVKLWNRGNDKYITTLSGHSGDINCVCFSPDGQIIASASRDNTVKLWNSHGKELKTLTGHSRDVTSVSFSSDGQTIASSSYDGTVKLWNLDGALMKSLEDSTDTLEHGTNTVYDICFSKDGKIIACASSDKTVKLWSCRDGRKIATLTGHTGRVNSVSISPNNQTIVSGSDDTTIKLWSSNGEEIKTFRGHSAKVNSVNFSPDGQRIASASDDGTVKLWDCYSQERPTLAQSISDDSDTEIAKISFSPDSKIIAGINGNILKLWNINTQEVENLNLESTLTSISFSPDGQAIAVGGLLPLKVYNFDSQNFTSIGLSKDNCVSFSPDGQMIASGCCTSGSDGTIKLWSRDGELLKTLPANLSGIKCVVCFSPDGQMIASSGHDSDFTIKLWSRDGELLKTLNGHKNNINSICFSPDSQIITSASSDNTIKLWNKHGELLKTLRGHDYQVFGASFSPDGQMIASADWDGTLKLWNLNGQLLKTLEKRRDKYSWLYGVSFSPDGQMIASPTSQGVLLWNFNLDDLVVRGCNWVRNYLKNNPNIDQSDRHLCDDVPTNTTNHNK